MDQATSSDAPGTGGQDIEIGDPGRLPAQPLVSVSLITYNHAPYVRQALDSVLMQQTDFPYEICVGEDGSTDGTREICLEYARRYPDKIRLFLRDRANPARQRYRVPYAHNGQATYEACRGKYTAFVEGDDYWTCPTKLAQQAAVLESNPTVTAVAHYTMRIPEEEPWKAHPVPDVPMRELTVEDLLRARFYIHTSSLLLRRGADGDRELFRRTPCGDVPLLFCQLLRGTGLMLPRVMSVYRLHGGGVFSAQPVLAQSRQTVALWEALQSFVPPALQPMHQIGYLTILTNATAECRRNGRPREALQNSRKALGVIRASRTRSWSARVFCRMALLESLLFPRTRCLRRRLLGRLRCGR